MDIEIGIAHLEYDETGKLIAGDFIPTMEVSMDEETISSLMEVKCQSEETIKDDATNIFAKWFQTMNEIELEDREEYHIVSEYTTPCEKYENGKIKSVHLLFSLKHR